MKHTDSSLIGRKALYLRSLRIWIIIIAVEGVHGFLRSVLIVPELGDFTSRQLGVLSGSLINFLITLLLIHRVNAFTPRQYLEVGVFWVVLTILFEVSLGLITGLSLDRIAEDYRIWSRGLMPLGLLALALSPLAAAKMRGLGGV